MHSSLPGTQGPRPPFLPHKALMLAQDLAGPTMLAWNSSLMPTMIFARFMLGK